MPNNIKNRIELIGTAEEIKSIIEKFNTHFEKSLDKTYDGDVICKNGSEFGWYNEETKEFTRRDKKTSIGLPEGWEFQYNDPWDRFPDFNKIIPMPEELHITSDGLVSLLENQFSWNEPLKHYLDMHKNHLKEDEKSIDNFCQAIKNYVKYGFACWHDWACANWGTKWNSYACEKEADNIFTFETAWSGVPELIKRMSLQFPEVEFKYSFADEDTGYNCAEMIIKNNYITYEYIPEKGSKEAYDLSFKLRPKYKNNYELVDGEYKYKEE